MVGDGERSVCNKSMLSLIVSHRNLQFNNLRLKLHSKVFREEDDELVLPRPCQRYESDKVEEWLILARNRSLLSELVHNSQERTKCLRLYILTDIK